MECIVLASNERIGEKWQYAVENLGEDWRCMPAASAEQALLQLRTWTDVLLLLPGRESCMLLRALTDAPLLAPPCILGIGWEAPDGMVHSPEALPGRLRDNRAEGRLPVLAEQHMRTVAEVASALLRALDMPRRLRAWAFLPEMAALTVVHPPLLNDLSHGLYPLIARRHGMTAGGVERSLRLCVESTWTHGSITALERFFGSSVDPERGKPTNREFLCRIQERLTLSMRRLV